MSSIPLSPELGKLLESICMGELNDVDARRLEDLLAADPSQCRHYVRFMHMHAMVERLEATSPSAVNVESRAPLVASRFPSSRSVVWSVLAVGILFACYIVGISWNMLSKDADIVPRAVATLRGSENVRWSESSPRLARASSPGATINTGEPLAIVSGLVELKLRQGATLLVEGPAEWSIDSANRATLHRGKLVARVPKAAIGFTLRTPMGRIVDLGTEFGVEVGEQGVTHVRVFEGTVKSQSTAMSKPTTQRLVAGQSVRIDAAGTTPVAGAASDQSLLSLSRKLEKSSRPKKIEVIPAIGKRFAFPAAKDDLINQGQPTLARTFDQNYKPFLQSATQTLNDGLLLPDKDPYVVGTAFDLDGEWTTTYELNTELHPTGYTIDEIRSIAEWAPDRCNQYYSVEFACVGSDVVWPLAHVRFDATGVDGATQVTLRHTAGPLAERVRMLRFTFNNPQDFASKESGAYVELDVVGKPTPPGDVPSKTQDHQ